MSYATIRSSVKTVLDGVAGISGGAGLVLAFEPEIVRPEELAAITPAVPDIVLNLWTISREAFREVQQDAGFRVRALHDLVVRGRFWVRETRSPGVNAEHLFHDLVDAVHAAIRGSLTIFPGSPEEGGQVAQSTISPGETREGHLVHTCETRFTVEEIAVLTA